MDDHAADLQRDIGGSPFTSLDTRVEAVSQRVKVVRGNRLLESLEDQAWDQLQPHLESTCQRRPKSDPPRALNAEVKLTHLDARWRCSAAEGVARSGRAARRATFLSASPFWSLGRPCACLSAGSCRR